MPDEVYDYLTRDGIIKTLEKFKEEHLDMATGVFICWFDSEDTPWLLKYEMDSHDAVYLLEWAKHSQIYPDNLGTGNFDGEDDNDET